MIKSTNKLLNSFNSKEYIRYSNYRLQIIQNILKKNFLKKKLKILDLGCGDGFFSKKLLKDGHKIDAMDARYNLSLSRIKNNFNYKKVNLSKYKKFKKYDCILLLNILYHLKDPENLIKILKKKAKMIFIDTVLLDANKSFKFIFKEDKFLLNSFDGYASRFTKKFLQNQFGKENKLIDISDKRLNIKKNKNITGLKYNWKIKNTYGFRFNGFQLRGFYVVNNVDE